MSNATAITFEADLSQLEEELDRFLAKYKAQIDEINRSLDDIEARIAAAKESATQ